jgi:hypothetical protein
MAKRQRRRRGERRREHARREGWKTRRSVITGAGIGAGTMLGLAAPALGADHTWVVNNNTDNFDTYCDANCSLRDAVYNANGYGFFAGESNAIVFDSSLTGSTITLTGQLSLYGGAPTYILGLGADKLTISGDDNSRIFNIGTKYNGDEVLIAGLTLTDGDAFAGGAVYNYNSALTVTDSRLTGNVAGFGAGIANSDYYANGQSMRVEYSTLDHNYAFYAGGAIAAQDSFGLIGGSTLDHNYAGIGNGNGGGVNAYGGFVFDSSISGNDAYAYGGGLFTFYTGLYNTLLANNTAGIGQRDLYTFFPFGYYDLVEHPDGAAVAGYNHIIGQDPQLGGLSNNGGPTPTLKPAASSPVVDKGFSDVGGDQRGSARTVDNPLVANAPEILTTPYNVVPNGTDIGSVELTLSEGPQPPPPPPAAVTPAKKKKKCKKKKKHRSAEAAKKKKCKKKKKRAVVARSADGTTVLARATRLEDAWRAERTGRLREVRKAHRDAGRDFLGRIGWPDGAWTIKDPAPRR